MQRKRFTEEQIAFALRQRMVRNPRDIVGGARPWMVQHRSLSRD